MFAHLRNEFKMFLGTLQLFHFCQEKFFLELFDDLMLWTQLSQELIKLLSNTIAGESVFQNRTNGTCDLLIGKESREEGEKGDSNLLRLQQVNL